MPIKNSYLTVTDQFCGAGGSSIGAEAAGATLQLALNHWQLAIDTHNTNFPHADHDCTDISACDPRRYRSTDILITSPECTNHSLAKGKKRKWQAQLELFGKVEIDPSEERSRATMWDVPRFAEFHDYRIIIVENVVDARYWRTWDAWLHAMDSLGYDHQIVYLNSMFSHLRPQPGMSLANGDYAPQSRDRMYVVFWKKGNKAPDLEIRPVAWCGRCGRDVEAVQSWKNGRVWGRYNKQYIYACPMCAQEVKPYYYAAANAIDWLLPAERIGDRKRPLKERTLARIQKGLEKFAGQAVLVPLAYTHGHDDRAKAVIYPWPTQTGRQDIGVAFPPLLVRNYSLGYSQPVTEPTGAITTQDHHSLVMPPFIMNNQAHNQPTGMDEPINTVLTGNHKYLVVPPPYIVEMRANANARSMGDPLSTIVASAIHHHLVIPPYIVEMYGKSNVRSIEEALSTVTAGVIHQGVAIPPFLAGYYGSDNVSPVNAAAPTVTTVDRQGLVVPPFFLGYANGDGPAHPITDPLLTQHTGNNAGLVQPGFIPAVDDCRFRMLTPDEVGRAMAFPEDYVVLGTNKDRVKQFGNGVTPPALKLLMARCIASLE
ncbi:MAG: DNA cytosine methyltransferase [Hyphomicrobiaceae bacterium]|nr:MAG: DNA cytosine methyltransferase [Hyphomicrobiaceae bacterium]